MNMTLNDLMTYGTALLFALLVHALAIGLVSVNWQHTDVSHTDIKPYYIEAAVVAENPHRAKAEREADRKKADRAQKIQERRQVEEKLRRDQAAWERRQKERKPAPAPEPRPLPEPEPIIEKAETGHDPEKARAIFAEEMALALAREADARRAVTDDEKAMAYVAQIQREIAQNWSRPPSARNGMKSLLRVHLIPTGEVIDVKIEESSGNDAFDRSAVQAVRKAGRFVVPNDMRRFERDFREFTVLFRPDDLRL